MGKAAKKMRLRKKYNYDTNRKKTWKKANKKATITEDNIKKAWDKGASVQTNLSQMGIAHNPNKSVPLPKRFKDEDVDSQPEVAPRAKAYVVERLAQEASIKREGTFRLSSAEALFCIYMMEKYGEDYKAMARDRTNYYQETPKQIRRKINQFKGIPQQYNAYLERKAAGEIDVDSMV